MPGRYGLWKTLWKRHVRLSNDSTWDRILEQLLSQADVAGQVDWQLSIDPTVSRVLQPGPTLSREVSAELPSHIWVRGERASGLSRA